MKRFFLAVSILLAMVPATAQLDVPAEKYPSLLWEITGKGMKKPSYLFGTMHVSSKMVFNLSDSFYLGIRSADMVALETNPETWQEDISRYNVNRLYSGVYSPNARSVFSMPEDYLNQKSLRFGRYEKLLAYALASNPSSINNLLYRSYGNISSDFEEDTYLDMYIYQVGKKWGKRVAGVERYEESMRLMMEAYADAARDKQRRRNLDYDIDLSPQSLQEAYRTGNLDLLDTINKLNSFSQAFDEKFLYRRNEIQAASIDSIIRSRVSLFVGVGAAHLPGNRGVIEILRQKGYRLRPVIMNGRDNRHKDEVEKISVPVTFSRQQAADGFFSVTMPGKLYQYADFRLVDQQQYADMANGSYYMITRVKTNGLLWGDGPEMVSKKLDSLLYENIPGKILEKKQITRNGYPGFDISNRTRRGDYQRYNIFITTYEVLFFKMSGTGDYVRSGAEARQFFESIQLREKNDSWTLYKPDFGGFSVQLPGKPVENINGLVQFDATDPTSGTAFTILRKDIHNFQFVEEDSFDLGLMDESFSGSDFIDKEISRHQSVFQGYPVLDCKYRHKDGSLLVVRYLIQGPHYYTLVAHGRKEDPAIGRFLNSFRIEPFIYGEAKLRSDSLLCFNVRSPVFPQLDESQELMRNFNEYRSDPDDEEELPVGESGEPVFRSRVIANDTTGEKIYVAFYKAGLYDYETDSSTDEDDNLDFLGADTSWIMRSRNELTLEDGTRVVEYALSDTNSSRMVIGKTYNRKGIAFALVALTDTLTRPSAFLSGFFGSFQPADTLTGIDPYAKKSVPYFADFFSGDSVAHQRAVENIERVRLDDGDLHPLKKAIWSLSWKEKNYMDVKEQFVKKLGDMKEKTSADFLKEVYLAAGDTVDIQYAALEALLQQQTDYSYRVFRDLVTQDPPVMGASKNFLAYKGLNLGVRPRRYPAASLYNGSFLDELYDSLSLTRQILPDLLNLITIDEYKWSMMGLLRAMVDSNIVSAKDYQAYFRKFLVEARFALKKQAIAEMNRAIEDKQSNNEGTDYGSYGNEVNGNEDLSVYATLLVPFWDSSAAVPPLFDKLLQSNDRRLRYNTMMLLLKQRKPVPDSLLTFFANLDEYRYELYTDLSEFGQLKRFPSRYNNPEELSRSRLLSANPYVKPDSVVFIKKAIMTYRNREGYVYFFKYKKRKDDAGWKFATVGIVDPAAKSFSLLQDADANNDDDSWQGQRRKYRRNRRAFQADFSDTRLRENEPLEPQLETLEKKIRYSFHKSARGFYRDRDEDRLNLGLTTSIRD